MLGVNPETLWVGIGTENLRQLLSANEEIDAIKKKTLRNLSPQIN